jgi:hypothetical protein
MCSDGGTYSMIISSEREKVEKSFSSSAEAHKSVNAREFKENLIYEQQKFHFASFTPTHLDLIH